MLKTMIIIPIAFLLTFCAAFGQTSGWEQQDGYKQEIMNLPSKGNLIIREDIGLFATAHGKTVRWWDLETGELVETIEAGSSHLTADFGGYITSKTEQKEKRYDYLYLYDIETNEKIMTNVTVSGYYNSGPYRKTRRPHSDYIRHKNLLIKAMTYNNESWVGQQTWKRFRGGGLGLYTRTDTIDEHVLSYNGHGISPDFEKICFTSSFWSHVIHFEGPSYEESNHYLELFDSNGYTLGRIEKGSFRFFSVTSDYAFICENTKSPKIQCWKTEPLELAGTINTSSIRNKFTTTYDSKYLIEWTGGKDESGAQLIFYDIDSGELEFIFEFDDVTSNGGKFFGISDGRLLVLTHDGRLRLYKIADIKNSFNAAFIADREITYPGEPVKFRNISSGTPDNYLWDFGDGTFRHGSDAQHSFDEAGSYEVRLIARQGNKIDTASTTIICRNYPDAYFDYQISGSNPWSFKATSRSEAPASEHYWRIKDVAAAKNKKKFNVNIKSVGEYKVRLIIDDGIYADTVRKVFRIETDKVHPINSFYAIDAGEKIEIEDIALTPNKNYCFSYEYADTAKRLRLVDSDGELIAERHFPIDNIFENNKTHIAISPKGDLYFQQKEQIFKYDSVLAHINRFCLDEPHCDTIVFVNERLVAMNEFAIYIFDRNLNLVEKHDFELNYNPLVIFGNYVYTRKLGQFFRIKLFTWETEEIFSRPPGFKLDSEIQPDMKGNLHFFGKNTFKGRVYIIGIPPNGKTIRHTDSSDILLKNKRLIPINARYVLFWEKDEGHILVADLANGIFKKDEFYVSGYYLDFVKSYKNNEFFFVSYTNNDKNKVNILHAILDIDYYLSAKEFYPQPDIPVQIWPNPDNGIVNISYINPMAGYVSAAIYDNQGKKIETIFDGELAAGTHEFRWNSAAIAPGAYNIVIQTANGSSATKCIIAR
jgi:PKD repeat protein